MTSTALKNYGYGKADTTVSSEARFSEAQFSNGHRPEQTSPQIGAELEYMHKAVANLTDEVSGLIAQIGAVMAPVNSQVLKDVEGPLKLPMSPLAHSLAEITAKLLDLAYRVQSARQAVQL